jgi:hypothetical protein
VFETGSLKSIRGRGQIVMAFLDDDAFVTAPRAAPGTLCPAPE